MVMLPVYDRSGQEVGQYEIDPAELAPRISKQLLHEAVIMYQANQRQGTFKTKTRGEVAGTTKKMYRQKGTGNARAGSRRSGIRRGGGHIHAIRPRDWTYRLTKKALRLATLIWRQEAISQSTDMRKRLGMAFPESGHDQCSIGPSA